jgi:hypothetical protein
MAAERGGARRLHHAAGPPDCEGISSPEFPGWLRGGRGGGAYVCRTRSCARSIMAALPAGAAAPE